MHIPLAFGLVGRDGKRHRTMALPRARPSRTASSTCSKRRHVVSLPASPSARPCRSIAASRRRVTLSVEQRRGGPVLPRRARQRRLLALAGLQYAAHRGADLGLRGRRARRASRQQFSPASWPSLPASSRRRRRLEHAFRALALALPGEADIAREIGGKASTPTPSSSAREALCGSRSARSTARRRCASSTRALADGGRVQPGRRERRTPRPAQRRCSTISPSLPGGAELAARHFTTATNMTDRAAALTVLAHRHAVDASQAKEALAALRGSATATTRWSWTSGSMIQADRAGGRRRSTRYAR